jgi:hypothetical protein
VLLVRVLIASPEGSSAPPGLVEALRIQLAGAAEVEDGGPLTGATLPERVRAAAAVAREREAALVVWIDASSDAAGATEHVLHVVSADGERALVEIARFSPYETDVERMLALSVGTLLDRVLSAPSLEAALGGEEPGRLALRIEAGAIGVAGRPGITGGLEIGAGPAIRRDRFEGELLGVGRFLAEVAEREPAGEVEVAEWSVSLALRALYRVGRLAAGLGAHAGVRFIDAEGGAPDGRRGQADQALAVLGAALEGRVELADGIDLRLAGGVDVSPARRRFALDGEPVLTLGRVRGHLTLSLSLSAP